MRGVVVGVAVGAVVVGVSVIIVVVLRSVTYHLHCFVFTCVHMH